MVCDVRIGRKDSLWIWKEATAGTEASSFVFIPLTTAPLIKPITEYVENESGYGRIEGVASKELVKKMSETSVEWRVWELTFGHILGATFWVTSAPSLIETGVYKHNFAILNGNCHQSYSVVTDSFAQELSLYNLLDTLSLTAEVWEVLSFSSTLKWKFWNATTWKTVSFASEKPFKISWMEIKFADNVAGLTGASAIKLQSLNFEVSKNVIDVTENGSLEPTSMNNQQVTLSGDFEAIYRDDTYKNYNSWETNKAMRITLTWTDLVWATEFAELNFDFWLINFDEWDKSTDNNWITTQNMWFTWLKGTDDLITAYLQNTQSTQY